MRIAVQLAALLLYFVSSPCKAWTEEERKHITDEAGLMQFQVYTRKNPTTPNNFELNDVWYLNTTPFNASRPTKILIHGWLGNWGTSFNILMRNALLIQSDVNVVVVSWDNMSNANYFAAKAYVETVGKVVAYLIDHLCVVFNVQVKDVHVIGHSLGAHAAGISGLFAVEKLPRVTGLDPAGPFYSMGDEMRISKKSADFVDIIHTASPVEGFTEAIGHVDFYPNGGHVFQPGCDWDFVALKSHRRAYWLYASSTMNPGQFLARNCSDWKSFTSGNCDENGLEEMGFHVSTKARGKYFLKTSGEMPYALGDPSKVLE